MIDARELMQRASTVRGNAYAPYSGYRVGAAVLDDTGEVHTGCNVENAAYPEGICAEAAAIAAMVAAGGKRIVTIAVAGGHDEPEVCTPCGGCRQRIREFADDATRIVVQPGDGELASYSVGELLPASFVLKLGDAS